MFGKTNCAESQLNIVNGTTIILVTGNLGYTFPIQIATRRQEFSSHQEVN